MFEGVLVGLDRPTAFCDLFVDQRTFGFELADVFFVGTDDAIAISLDQSIHELSCFAIDL